MRFVTLNLLHGRSLSDGRVDMGRVVDAIAALAPDVLAVQEVDRGQERSGGVDQTAVIGRALGMSYRFAPSIIGEPGAVWRAAHSGDATSSSEPAYGVGLLVRGDVSQWGVQHLRPSKVRSPVAIPGARRLMWLRDEPRVVLSAVLPESAPVATVACTHLSFVPGWNVRQLRWARKSLETGPHPVMLLGDLNLPGRVARLVMPWTPLGDTPTYPAPRPRIEFDHVFVRGLPGHFRSAARVVEVTFSDHRAVVVDIHPADTRPPDIRPATTTGTGS